MTKHVIGPGRPAEPIAAKVRLEKPKEDSLFAWAHDGEPIPPEHGGPVRLIIPQLYAWKSAKWVKGVRFLEHDQAGYWEEGGYHMRGVPWGPGDGERFRWS